MRRTLPLLATAMLACSGDASCAGERQGARAEGSASETHESPRPSTHIAFAAPSPDTLAELQARFAAHELAGATAFDAGQLSSAVTELSAAVALDPMNPGIWSALAAAQHQAAAHQQAVRALSMALHHVDDPKLRATLLFELGRAHEGAEQDLLARELYQRSLELVPSELVANRLSILTGGVEVVGHARCGWTAHGPTRADPCAAFVSSLDGPPRRCTGDQADPSGLALPRIDVAEGRALSLFSYLEADDETEVFMVAAIIDGQWSSSPLAWVHHPAAGYADEAIERIEVRAEDLARGGLPEIVIEWDIGGRALLLGPQQQHAWRSTNIAVLSIATHDPRWLLGARTHSRRDITPLGGGETTTDERGVEIAWTTQTGELEFVRAQHEPSARLGKYALGTYPLLCPIEIDAS